MFKKKSKNNEQIVVFNNQGNQDYSVDAIIYYPTIFELDDKPTFENRINAFADEIIKSAKNEIKKGNVDPFICDYQDTIIDTGVASLIADFTGDLQELLHENRERNANLVSKRETYEAILANLKAEMEKQDQEISKLKKVLREEE